MIELATIEGRVIGEAGKVFSTDPEVATGVDGKTYYIKGRNGPTAFSEVAGCLLAALVGLRVPKASVCRFNGDLYGGVERVPRAVLSIAPWLRNPERINNSTDLFSVIAVDTWLANDDRNMGNLVGSPDGGGRIDVFMIDFEKSHTLGESPFMGSGNLNPAGLWPRDELGRILGMMQPRECPEAILHRIAALSPGQIGDAVTPVAAVLPFVHWHESSIEVLIRRARNIGTLVEEVWERT